MNINEVHKFNLLPDISDFNKKHVDVPKLCLDSPKWSSIFLTYPEQEMVKEKAAILNEKYYKSIHKKINKPNKFPLQHIYEEVTFPELPKVWYTL